jgi:hypothetical protein
MIEVKFDDFHQFNYNIVDLLAVKEIICGFRVHNVANVLWGKQISLDSLDISHIFKLPTEGIVVLAQKTYNEKWSKYFEGGKEKHYKQDSRYIFAKVRAFGM